MLLAGLVAAVCGLVAWTTHAARSLEDTTVALRFQLRPADRPDDLAVVGIDAATFSDYAQQQRWPYPRSWHADVLDELRRLGARKVVYDVQFTEATTPREDGALYDAIGRFPGTILATTETDEHGATNVLGGDENLARVARPGRDGDLPDPGRWRDRPRQGRPPTASRRSPSRPPARSGTASTTAPSSAAARGSTSAARPARSRPTTSPTSASTACRPPPFAARSSSSA